MAEITPYADHQKALLIAQLSLLPDGVQNFLTTELPEPPTISTPGDVDSAIIANGLCAKFVCDAFRPFAGLTPVEMLMRISQLNDWTNAGVLSGLQQWAGASVNGGGEGEGSEERADFEIVAPSDGATFQPGPVRLQVRPIVGTLQSVEVMVSGNAPISLSEETGQFWGLVYLSGPGSVQVSVQGFFTEDRTLTKVVSLTIADDGSAPPGETGGDDDLKGIDLLKKVFDGAVGRVLGGVGDVGEVISAARRLRRAPFPGGQGGASGGGGASDTWGTRVDAAIDAILQEGQT